MADKFINELPVTTTISDTDVFVVEDNAVTSKITKLNLKETLGINSKAPQATTYTKTEVDTSLGLKANKTQQAWQPLTLLNSWVNYGSPFADASYYKDDFGVVHIKGMVRYGGVTQTLFTLPVGYRPPEQVNIPVVSNGLSKYIRINTDGNCIPLNITNEWVDLITISFRTY